MNERLIAFRVGVVVLAAACLAALMIAIFGGGRTVFRGGYTVFMRFPRAPGVAVDTPVRKNGILIGRITHVELDVDHVDLTARIDSQRQLPENDVPWIRTSSLLGDSHIEFASQENPSSEFIQDKEFIADGRVASDPLEVLTNLEGDTRAAIVSIKTAADEVTGLANSLNQTLGTNDAQLQRIIDKTELALDGFNRTMTTVDDVIGDPQLKESLKRTLAEFPELFDDVKLTMSEAREAMASFERVGQKAERNLDNIEEFTRPLGEKGDQLMRDIARTAQNFEELSGQLAVFSEAMNDPNGTIGRFVHDREVYDDVRETVSILNETARRIRPILEDVRIATDKIATDPGGVLKRALDKKPAGVGRKWSDSGIPLRIGRESDTAPRGR